MYYLLPGSAAGGRSPVWDAIGYSGPLGVPSDAPPRAITPLAVDRDTALDCDVCIVGSGAGGGTAAGVLAERGLDVVVLEAGDYYDERDFDGAEHAGFSRMYLNGGGAATSDQSVGLLAGACLGGGTTVNYSTSFTTPEDVGRSGRRTASRRSPARSTTAASPPSATAWASTRSTTVPPAATR